MQTKLGMGSMCAECGKPFYGPHEHTPRIVAECWNCGTFTDKHPAGVKKEWWTRKPLTIVQEAACRAAGHDVRPGELRKGE